jgi:PAS domain S-box-containing protein
VLGYTPEEYMSLDLQEIFSLVHPDDVPALLENALNLVANPEQEEVYRTLEYRIKHRELGYRWVSDHRSVIYDDSGSPIAVVGNLRDITERKKAEQKLRKLYEREKQLRKQLETEMKRRVEFTRALAHELKTPLTSVLASSDLLASEVLDESLSILSNNIKRGALNLNSRIDELLDLARGEVGMLNLKPEHVDIRDLLRTTVASMTPLASKRGQSLILSMPASLPPVRADASRLQQVVTNLISNALKYTPVGGTIKLKARPKDDNLVIEIRDTGPGIAKEDQKSLFEPYHQNGIRSLSGLGMGLALCKILVELHEGRIWVRSRAGKGSTFGFSLPLAGGDTPAEEQIQQPKLWKILIIEDDQSIVNSISTAFQMRWPEVELISSDTGEAGLIAVGTENPDLVILDLGLPDIDGFDVLKKIRSSSSIPVVILTVREGEEERAKATELGADAFVTKPFRPQELLALLKSQLVKASPVST